MKKYQAASQITRRIAALCQAAGLDGDYGASSPRVGQAQDYAEAGWTVEQLAGFVRWQSLDAAWGYIRRSRGYQRLRSLHNPTLCV